LRDYGGWLLLLTFLCKNDHSFSMTFKSGESAGHGSCRSASSCPSNKDWTLLACEWANCHLDKFHHS
jgi:hypothetical protein